VGEVDEEVGVVVGVGVGVLEAWDCSWREDDDDDGDDDDENALAKQPAAPILRPSPDFRTATPTPATANPRCIPSSVRGPGSGPDTRRSAEIPRTRARREGATDSDDADVSTDPGTDPVGSERGRNLIASSFVSASGLFRVARSKRLSGTVSPVL